MPNVTKDLSYPSYWTLAKNASTEDELKQIDRLLFDAMAQLDEDKDYKLIEELLNLGTQISMKITILYRKEQPERFHLNGNCECISCAPENYLDYDL